MSVKQSLLALLSGEATSARGLLDRYAQLTQGIPPLTVGQLELTLSLLHREGLIELAGRPASAGGGGIPVYQPTSAGRAETARWLSTADDNDDLIFKVSLAVAGFTDLLALLDAHRHAALSQLREVTLASRDLPVSPAASRLRVERRILDLEAEIRFLDRVEALHREKKRP